MKQSKYVIRYQIYNNEGNTILQPFADLCAAEYMSNEYFSGSTVIEIEVEI